MFEQQLQVIAEQLENALQRSVIIDDVALRPVAVSAQSGLVDAIRVEAVLQRRTSARHRHVLTEHGIFKARKPVSIPASDPGILPRLCLPLVQRDQLLGFLWLIDEPPLTAEQIQRAEAAAAQASRLLQRRAARQAAEFSTFAVLADALLQADAPGRAAAARTLTDDAALTGPPPYALALIRYLGDPPAGGPDDLLRVAGDLRRRAAPGSFVLATPGQHELVAITTQDAAGPLRDTVRALPGPQLVTGTAGAAAALEAVHDHLDNARYAAEVAAAVPAFGRAVDWGELGSYAVFQHLPRDQAAPERICPGITTLLTDRTRMYETTIRAYLDSGANAQQTAALLNIHRTTLYWRLARVSSLLAVDLSRGDDRLNLHLALKLAELTRPGRKATRHD
ncbi:MAG TPA: helix-turn-helix domain-containing protein [Streptosporangiaceae bacterium]